MRPTLVVIESPYAREKVHDIAYAKQCMKDSLARGEYPLSNCLLYTEHGILNLLNATDRYTEIASALGWMTVADRLVVYLDHGLTPIMEASIRHANAHRIPVDYRRIKNSASPTPQTHSVPPPSHK